MTARVLVVSTVHQADDTRVRERTVGVLAEAFTVRYATRAPAPARGGDHEWVELEGGRLRRMLGALRQALRRDVDVVSLHDPELVPVGVLVRVMRRRAVVFDVHEDVPAQMRTKEWLPAASRPVASVIATAILGLAERTLTLTLAEPGYRRLFRGPHPVLPNHPLVEVLPGPAPSSGEIVYVGDVTTARGARVAVEAVSLLRTPRPLVLVGRCPADLAAELRVLAERVGTELELTGPLPHPEAMRRAATAAVGVSPLLDLPNYRHSLPTKVIEYLALGLPVVASDLPGTADVVRGETGVHLAAPGDPGALAAALERACRTEVRQAAAVAAAGVRRRYVWPADLVVELYRAAAARPPRRRIPGISDARRGRPVWARDGRSVPTPTAGRARARLPRRPARR